MTTTGGGNPKPHDGQSHAELAFGAAAPSGVSKEPRVPPMVRLSVPLGDGRGDFEASIPVYEWERPSLDVLEYAIRHVAEQAIRKLRSETWLWEESAAKPPPRDQSWLEMEGT